MFRYTMSALLLAGCGGLSSFTGANDTLVVDTVTDSDVRSDTLDTEESDVVVDTDFWDTADTDESDLPVEDSDTDTAPPVATSYNGTYRGTFRANYSFPVVGSAVCDGPMTLIVDDAANPQLTANVSCSWPLLNILVITNGLLPVSGSMTGYFKPSNPAKANGTLDMTDGDTFNETLNFNATFTNTQVQIVYDNVILGIGVRGNFKLNKK